MMNSTAAGGDLRRFCTRTSRSGWRRSFWTTRPTRAYAATSAGARTSTSSSKRIASSRRASARPPRDAGSCSAACRSPRRTAARSSMSPSRTFSSSATRRWRASPSTRTSRRRWSRWAYPRRNANGPPSGPVRWDGLCPMASPSGRGDKRPPGITARGFAPRSWWSGLVAAGRVWLRAGAARLRARLVALVLVLTLLLVAVLLRRSAWRRAAVERADPRRAGPLEIRGELVLAGLIGLLELLPVGCAGRLRRIARIDVSRIRRRGRAVVLHALSEVIHLLPVGSREVGATEAHHSHSAARRGRREGRRAASVVRCAAAAVRERDRG